MTTPTTVTRALRSAALACATATLMVAGCGGRSTLRELSMGRYHEPHAALFERTLDGLTALGYAPTSIDGEHGTIVVDATYVSRRDGRAQFHVQLYREGWIAVTVSGGPVRRDAHGAQVPGELADEYIALALGLREHVEHLSRGALGR